MRNNSHFITSLPFYVPTPLVRLDCMAKRLGLKAIYVKDESKRFGLNSFKGLGGLYAVTYVIAKALRLDMDMLRLEDLQNPPYREKIQRMVFVTATDGNHGKGISWVCGLLGCRVYVYMPEGSSELRAQAIRDVNPRAEVIITDLGYDDAVRYAAYLSRENGWYLVQDTAWEGYEEIPARMIEGYTVMVQETCDEMERQGMLPTHVFLQAGVGSMAGGITQYLVDRYGNSCPAIGIVEPENMACIFASARQNDGKPHALQNPRPTIMAGLSCGEPCALTWPILRDHADWFIKCPDAVTICGMRLLAAPEGGDQKVISGESGAVTVGLLNIAAKGSLQLNENSVVLCFSTEGDTDPESYKTIVEQENVTDRDLWRKCDVQRNSKKEKEN